MPARFHLSIALLLAAARLSLAQQPSNLLIQGNGKAAILDPSGRTLWEVPCLFVSHDMTLLPNGNLLLHTGPATIREITPEKRTVWEYTARPKAGYSGAIEIHAFQRLASGLTMVAESGNRRIVEVNLAGEVVKEIPLSVENPNAHRDTRRVRKLKSGNYLVCHEGDGAVREYDGTGKVVWTYRLDLNDQPRTPGHDGHGLEVFNALRLTNGNTLIGGGNNNRVFEVTPRGKTVWSVERDELPGIRLCWITNVEALPNGNVRFANTHAGPGQPQIVEVNRRKEVVWSFSKFEEFGNDVCCFQTLDPNEPPFLETSVRREKVGKIPVLVHSPKETQGRSLVIWLTGFSGSRDSVERELRDLARRGYVALSFDPYQHGERMIDPSREALSRRVRGNIRKYFWPILARTAEETTQVIDWAIRELGVRPEVGMGGVSMGGDIAVTAAGVDRRIEVVSAVVAAPDWLRQGSFEPPGAPDEEAQADYDRRNPMTHLSAYRHKPWIAFQSGQNDRQVPPDGGLRFVAALKSLYGRAANRLVVNLQPKTPHAFTPEMWAWSLDWFGAHLGQGTGPARNGVLR